ncbi:MAG: sulfite exporter TauE/SafE family protein [Candidatus Kapabacteria bacterium]|nr:sulfite exporter TauE/SafE family protein [Candidatus Kapabacteria bacterium]
MHMDVAAALALGLAGSLHCAGMCGPIAASLPATSASHMRYLAGRAAYNVGRVMTYAALGSIVGLGGSAISLAGYGRVLSIVSGVMMIGLAVAQLVFHRSVPVPAMVLRLTMPLRQKLGHLLQRHGILALFGIGLLNGMLPCGLVTAALAGAAGAGSVLSAATFMAVFGLGTTPMMAALAVGIPLATDRWRSRLRVAAPVIALVMGTIITIRGMGLGIPMLSPAVPKVATTSACCSGH